MPLTSWTDSTLTSGQTLCKAVHVNEVRNAINRWRRFYGLGNRSWTDGTITAGTTGVRKVHFDEMRSELNSLRGSAFSWTDGTITAGVTAVRKVHMDELRANTNWLEQNKCYTCDTCDNDYCSCDSDRICNCEGDTGCCDSDYCICDHDMGCMPYVSSCGCEGDRGCGVDGACLAYDGLPGCLCENYYGCNCDTDYGCCDTFSCCDMDAPDCRDYCNCEGDTGCCDTHRCNCDSYWTCSTCDGQCNRVVNCYYS